MGMIETIVDYMNTNYTSCTFVRYGTEGIPSPPYCVVKSEKGINGRNIRVILHRNAGEQELLESDLRAVCALLENKGFTSGTVYNRLGRMIDYTDVGAVSDDNTISMEALFLMPTQTF